MAYKKVQLTFNLDNKMQAELLDKCMKEFGTNLSGGIKNILTLYFDGGLENKTITQTVNFTQQDDNVDSDNIFSSVL